ncbi:E3 ubiquitin-protein ligase ATL41-like [Aristolochia californica]|uniref:E3 ubiquitin-protein ligase ATL41-like n=1 Tax=Aristolochia californica TaxID=171875 RepID=UPI0035D7B50B
MAYEDHWSIRRQYGFNNRIMIIAVVCLFFVVFLVLFLHLYARCVMNRRRQRRRAMALAMGIDLESDRAQAHPEPPKTGLDPSVIASLPIFIYKANQSTQEASIECAICLSALKEDEAARLLPNCKHTFHAQCVDVWLNHHSTCPICRTGAEPRPEVATNDSGGVGPSAPQLDREGTPDVVGQTSKASASSSSRLSSFSFRRILSREKSDRRLQHVDQSEDPERQ